MGFLKTTFTLLGLAGGSYIGVSSAMAARLTQTTRVRPEEDPTSVGLDYENVSFSSRGGDAELSGWFIPPETVSNTPGPVYRGNSWIAMVNGDNTNRSDSKIGTMGIARELHRHGFGVLMFDLRGRGDSPTELSSSGYFERLDLQGASDFLVSRGVESSRIGVLGFSLGGVVALLAGSNPNTYGAVVSDSAFADLGLMLKHSMTGFKRPLRAWLPGMEFMARILYRIDVREISPAREIAQSDTPVLIIHGEEDSEVPVEHARLLGRAIGASFDEIETGQESVWMVQDAGHTGAFRTQPKAYIEKIVKFFEAHLGAPRNSNSSTVDSTE